MKYLTINNKNYKLINKDTKMGQELIQQYNCSGNYSVQHCYGRPSYRKIAIENEIENWMRENKCYNYKILTYCIMNFKCGYLYGVEQDHYLLVETHAHNYAVKL